MIDSISAVITGGHTLLPIAIVKSLAPNHDGVSKFIVLGNPNKRAISITVRLRILTNEPSGCFLRIEGNCRVIVSEGQSQLLSDASERGEVVTEHPTVFRTEPMGMLGSAITLFHETRCSLNFVTRHPSPAKNRFLN